MVASVTDILTLQEMMAEITLGTFTGDDAFNAQITDNMHSALTIIDQYVKLSLIHI